MNQWVMLYNNIVALGYAIVVWKLCFLLIENFSLFKRLYK